MIIKGDPVLLGNLKSWRCLTVGVYFIDKSGNLIGKQTREGYLDPILLQDDSFSASLIKGTDTTKQKDTIKFDISQLEDDADLRMIEGSKVTANLLGVGGLVDVALSGTPSTLGTAEDFTVQLNTPFGGITSPIPAEGMDANDFYLYNLNTTSQIVPISVAESTVTAGEYLFTFAAQTVGDVIRVSNPITGNLLKSFDLTTFNVTL